jgi:hypothetical protein
MAAPIPDPKPLEGLPNNWVFCSQCCNIRRLSRTSNDHTESNCPFLTNGYSCIRVWLVVNLSKFVPSMQLPSSFDLWSSWVLSVVEYDSLLSKTRYRYLFWSNYTADVSVHCFQMVSKGVVRFRNKESYLASQVNRIPLWYNSDFRTAMERGPWSYWVIGELAKDISC